MEHGSIAGGYHFHSHSTKFAVASSSRFSFRAHTHRHTHTHTHKVTDATDHPNHASGPPAWVTKKSHQMEHVTQYPWGRFRYATLAKNKTRRKKLYLSINGLLCLSGGSASIVQPVQEMSRPRPCYNSQCTNNTCTQVGHRSLQTRRTNAILP